MLNAITLNRRNKVALKEGCVGYPVYIKKSEFGGHGVFATTCLEKNTLLCRYCPFKKEVLICQKDDKDRSLSFYGYTFCNKDNQRVFVDGLNEKGDVEHWTAKINHSFHYPNINVDYWGFLSVKQKIEEGEELLINYGNTYWRSALPKTMTWDESQLQFLFLFPTLVFQCIELFFEHLTPDNMRYLAKDFILSTHVHHFLQNTTKKELFAVYTAYYGKFGRIEDKKNIKQSLKQCKKLTLPIVVKCGHLFDKVSSRKLKAMWSKHFLALTAEVDKRRQLYYGKTYVANTTTQEKTDTISKFEPTQEAFHKNSIKKDSLKRKLHVLYVGDDKIRIGSVKSFCREQRLLAWNNA